MSHETEVRNRSNGLTPLRVLLATDNMQVGGVQRIVVELSRGLAGQGIELGVLAESGGPLWDEVPASVQRHAGRPVVRALRHVVGFLRLARAVRRGRYDIVHAHQRGVASMARILSVVFGFRVVEHVHNTFAVTRVSKLASFRGHALIACGSAVARMLVDDFGRSRKNVWLIYNGVADPGIAAVARSVGGPRRIALIGAGRLVWQKDPVRFVRVIDYLVQAMPSHDVRAEWLGDGPLRYEMELEVTSRGLEDKLVLRGEQDSITPWLAASDYLLLTSRHEGLPLVALEALALGKPIIVPDVGSCRDAIGSPPTGLLFDVNASDAVIAGMIAAELLGPYREMHQTSARAMYEKEFTLQRMLRSVVQVYDASVSRRETCSTHE